MPAENLIGEEGAGFKTIMLNFNDERLGMASSCASFSRVCLDEAIAHARERHTFGKPLSEHQGEHQVIRHKLVEADARKTGAGRRHAEPLVVEIQHDRHGAARRGDAGPFWKC